MKVSPRIGPDYLPGDLVHIDNITDEICKEFNGCHGVVIYPRDDQGGWLVSAAPGVLRCVAEELTMMTPREERA